MPSLTSPSPLTVLQILPALKDGGVERSTIEMVWFLSRNQHTPLVVSQGGPKTDLVLQAGGRHTTLPVASKNPLTMLWNVFRLRRILIEEQVSVVHARSRAPAWSAWAAARLCGVPFVCTFHGTYGLRGGAVKRFYNSIMLRSPVAIANSQFIKRHIVENYHYPTNDIIVAPRGIEPAAWNPDTFSADDRKAVRLELNVPEGTPLFLMVGRISPWKGHTLLLHALGLLSRRRPWVVAFAGGDEGLESTLRALAQTLGIADRVRWLGSRSDTPRLLAASTLAFSCSTRPEAFGRVAIEAMAMGVPIIATGLGGSLETVLDGRTGWLVPPANAATSHTVVDGFEPQALADKIEQALSLKDQLVKMGQIARQHVLAQYTVEACCSAEMQAYRRVIELQNKAGKNKG